MNGLSLILINFVFLTFEATTTNNGKGKNTFHWNAAL